MGVSGEGRGQTKTTPLTNAQTHKQQNNGENGELAAHGAITAADDVSGAPKVLLLTHVVPGQQRDAHGHRDRQRHSAHHHAATQRLHHRLRRLHGDGRLGDVGQGHGELPGGG